MVDFINSKKNRKSPIEADVYEKERKESLKKEEEKRSVDEVDIKRYKDRDGLTLSKINWGLFYVEQRENLITIRNGFFIFFSIMVWGGYAYVFGSYLLYGANADAAGMKSLLNANNYLHNEITQIAPKPIIHARPAYLSRNNKYDFYSTIENVNSDFFVEFKYSFLNNGAVIETKEGYLLPSSKQYIVALGQEMLETVGDVTLQIDEIKWTRIDKHKYGVYENYLDDHLNVEIKNKEYIDARNSGLAGKNNLGLISFEATNKTPYNYKHVDFVILSKYGSKVVDVNKYRSGKFESNETKKIDVLLTKSIPYINVIEIYVYKNIFDEFGYVDFDVNEGIMKR